jgi:hypothetical protein
MNIERPRLVPGGLVAEAGELQDHHAVDRSGVPATYAGRSDLEPLRIKAFAEGSPSSASGRCWPCRS